MKEIIQNLVQKHPELQKKEIIIDIIKAHQELTKDKLFTQLDMYKALTEFRIFLSQNVNTSSGSKHDKIKSIIQSLLPKTEWEVEITSESKIVLL